MKLRTVILIILLIIFADQALKIWIKTDFLWKEQRPVFGKWFYLYFTENDGMAWGMKFGERWGKIFLTLFRLAAVGFGSWYLVKIVKEKYHKGFIICASMIFAGALGNLIDSLFYGLIFDKGMPADPALQAMGYDGLARFSSHGYSSFLHGNVVDMLYFPLFEGHFPQWVPFIGGDRFEFFNAIFNIADASISLGVITLLLFQKKFIHKQPAAQELVGTTTNTEVSDDNQVQ